MCGIYGRLSKQKTGVDLAKARRCLNLVRHRGPDDEGFVLINRGKRTAVPCAGDDTVAALNLPRLADMEGSAYDLVLGHRRLAVLDLSPAGHQPMATPQGRYWITFGGEVYNYLELRSELKTKGYSFNTRADTEVLLAAYDCWGAGCLTRFIGMFAFCIFDTQKQELFLARDIFGIKPLYYADSDSEFTFASEIKPIIEASIDHPQVHPGELYRYLRFGLLDGANDTLFSQVKELPPGHCLTLSADEAGPVAPRAYWRLTLPETESMRFDATCRELYNILETSIRLHLRSDVPLGVCLSGGLDSTAIAMFLSRLVDGEKPVRSFSFIADDPLISEERFVRVATRAAPVVSTEVRPTPAELARDLPDLVRTQELPFVGTSVYAQYRVFQLAGEHGMKVMLDGQGGDELFAGYYHFIGARFVGLVASGRFLSALRVLRGYPRGNGVSVPRQLLIAGGRLLPRKLHGACRFVVGEPFWPAWLNRKWFAERGVAASEIPYGTGRDALRQEMASSVTQSSLPQLLRYEDRNSMRFSIESRVPFCTLPLLEFAFRLPEECLVSSAGITKSVLKNSVADLVPKEIVWRQKIAFDTPEREWTGHLIAGRALTDPFPAGKIPFLNAEPVRAEMEEALGPSAHFRQHVWRIFNVLEWLRAFNVGLT